ncbi:membrane-bound serine racemase VanT [Enterococcus sp. LJL51]|uniref:membrane-bound serine racemase VanT n=1 Tax=Enterococcus sp. LJL51 TaxID=3416656 RepID=UPI003CFA6336
MDKPKQRRAWGIDQFRLLAAVMVVGIHTFPFHSIYPLLDNVLTLTVFRIAVPFFFMVTGYYLLGPYGERPVYQKWWRIKRGVIQLLKLYGAVCLLYLPLSFYTGVLSFSMPVSALLKVLLIEGPLYHLWYFPAIILGVFLCVCLIKKLGLYPALLVSGCLYLIGLGGDSYYFLIKNNNFFRGFYELLFQATEYTRNGLFFAPIFLLLGVYAYVNREKRILNLTLKLFICLLLLVIEGALLHNGNPLRHDSMYLCLPLVMYVLFQSVLRWKPSIHIAKAKSYSLGIYILHPLSIAVLAYVGKGIPFLQNSLLQFLLVLLLTVIICMILIALFEKKRKKTGGTLRRAEKKVDKRALAANLKLLQKLLSEKTRVMAVLKANAYGHGAVKCGKELEKLGVDFYAVATLEEGVQLRKAGLQGEILILGYTDPDRIKELNKYNLIQTIIHQQYAVLLNRRKIPIRCHLKIDTGMHRLGFSPDLMELLPTYKLPFLKCEGIYSHLGSTDSQDDTSRERTRQQIHVYDRLLEELEQAGIDYGMTHLQSSYGVVNYPELTYDYARIGLFLYGVLSQTDYQLKEQLTLKPVLSIQAILISVKSVAYGQYLGYGTGRQAVKGQKVGVVSIGYADGISRNLSETGYRLSYEDQELPQIGMICMDMLLVDLTEAPAIQPGVVITVLENGEEAAKKSQTITNEILSRIGSRLEN